VFVYKQILMNKYLRKKKNVIILKAKAKESE
jgi:hypothetical protein